MKRQLIVGTLLALFTLSTVCSPVAAEAKIKALYVSGGGYHDYENTTPDLVRALGEMIPVNWTVKYGIEPLADEDFGEDYDVIVYDFCFPGEQKPEGMEKVLRVTRQGKPTVIVHCATVCFMSTEGWKKMVGQTIQGHDPYGPLETEKVDPGHPILKNFPDDWKSEGDELYLVTESDEGIHPLLKAASAKDGKEHIVAWTHRFGEGRVFATSLGHDRKTLDDKAYQRLLADGILWAVERQP